MYLVYWEWKGCHEDISIAVYGVKPQSINPSGVEGKIFREN